MLWLNISNLFTILRILITPLIAINIINGNVNVALYLAIFASITDFLDGYLARALNLETEIGACLDPIADKIFLLTCFIALFLVAKLPVWFVYLMVMRELIIVLGVLIIKYFKPSSRIRPTIFGKINTVLLIVLIFFNLLNDNYGLVFEHNMKLILLLVGLFGFFSLIHYIKIGIKLMQAKN